MASDKQLRANRANAQRSTGPKSTAGKARSRLNARKHGLTAETLIIVGENADDFEAFRSELLEQHDPQSALEAELVERLAGILWRLRRVPFFEAAILEARDAYLEDQASRLDSSKNYYQKREDTKPSVRVGDVLIFDGAYSDALGKLSRHETSLMNCLTKTLHMLLLLEENRDNGKASGVTLVALPAAA